MITLTATIEVPSADPIEINRNNIISIDSSIFDRSDLKMPSFGLISNTGSIKFIDTNGTIERYAQNRLLTGGMNVSISLNNTLYKRTQQIASLETKQWNYDNESRVVDVSLTSGLEILQEAYVSNLPYDFETKTPLSAGALLTHINEYLFQFHMKHTFFDWMFDLVDASTKDILNNTFIKYAYIKDMTLWNALQHLAEVCQLHMYRATNINYSTVKYNGGN